MKMPQLWHAQVFASARTQGFYPIMVLMEKALQVAMKKARQNGGWPAAFQEPGLWGRGGSTAEFSN